MSNTQQAPSAGTTSRRRLVIAVVVVALIIAGLGAILLWTFFFGSEAPAAPTLEDALKVLLPTASPGA